MRLKLVLPVLLLLWASGPVEAQTTDVQVYCHGISQFARGVMQGRQAGRTEAEMLATKAPNPVLKQLGEILIKAAFSEPVSDTQELKQRAVNKFERLTETACNEAGASR